MHLLVLLLCIAHVCQAQQTQKQSECDDALVQLNVKMDRHSEQQNEKMDKILEQQKECDEAKSCDDLTDFQCDEESGVVTVHVHGKPITLYCEVDTQTDPPSHWLVILRRIDDRFDFHRRLWNDMKHGFGDVEGSYWLGLESVHLLTNSVPMTLQVDLEDFDGESRYAAYNKFIVGPEWSKYRLDIGFYFGTAGDSLAYHNGMQFTTEDQDNDLSKDRNCATYSQGAWWHNACKYSSLMGEYLGGSHSKARQGMMWVGWKGNSYSYKTATMKIKPRN